MRCGLESLLSCSWGTQGPEDLAQGFVMKTAGIGERSGFQPRPVPDVGPGPGLASPAGHSCSCPGGDFEQLELQQLGPLEPAAFTLECPHPRPSVPRKSTRASGFLTGWLRPPSQSPGTARVAVVSWPAPAGLQPRRGWGGPCPSHPPTTYRASATQGHTTCGVPSSGPWFRWRLRSAVREGPAGEEEARAAGTWAAFRRRNNVGLGGSPHSWGTPACRGRGNLSLRR